MDPNKLNPQLVGVLTLAATSLGSIAVAHGWLTADQAQNLPSIVLTAAGAAVTVGGFAFSVWHNQHAKLLDRAANMPGVTSITVTPDLANATVSPKVVSTPAK